MNSLNICLKSLILLPLFQGLLPGQGCFFYPDSNPAAGKSCNVMPFGTGGSYWANIRVQFLIPKTHLPKTGGLLTGLGFTPCRNGNGLIGSFEIKVGHNTTGRLGGTFATNFVKPVFTVLKQANYKWPHKQNTWTKIPLSKPFPFNGKDNLVVDLTVLKNNLGRSSSFRTGNGQRLYVVSYTNQTTGRVDSGALKTALYFGNSCATKYGNGCKGVTPTAPAIEAETPPKLGSLFKVAVKSATSLTPALLIMGNRNKRWGSMSLPLDLSTYGAKGCFLNTSLVSIFARQTDTKGYAFQPIGLPNFPPMEGCVIYFQWFVVSPKSNTLGIIASQGLKAEVGK